MSKQPQGGGGGGGGGGEGGNDAMWIAVFFAGLLVILWITRVHWFPYLLKFKYYELYAVSYFYNVDLNIFEQLIRAEFNPGEVEVDQAMYLMQQVGSTFNIPVIIILVIMAIAVYLKNPGSKFSKTFTINSFRDFQKKIYPQIIAPSKVDLIKADINEGPWASSYTPLQFARKYKLLDVIVNPNPNPLLGELPKVAKLKEGKARQVFAAQLGYMWQGVDKLPIHQKALFAVFAAIANQDRKTGIGLLKQFNVSLLYKDTPDFSGVEEVVKKYKNSKLIKKVEKRHAYVITFMAALLELARTDGVLASADFVWLKPIDRKMWYMLNNVGRRAAFSEVAGAIAHWRIESRMQRKLTTPMVEEAVKALKIGVNEIIYPEDDD